MKLIMRRKLREPRGAVERRALDAWNCGTPNAAMRILLDAGYDYTERMDFLRHVANCREDPEYWAESGNIEEGS